MVNETHLKHVIAVAYRYSILLFLLFTFYSLVLGFQLLYVVRVTSHINGGQGFEIIFLGLIYLHHKNLSFKQGCVDFLYPPLSVQGVAADWSLSDPLGYLSWSSVSRFHRRTTAQRIHHRRGAEALGLRHGCRGEVALGIRGEWNVPSYQAGLRRVPWYTVLTRHGQCCKMY